MMEASPIMGVLTSISEAALSEGKIQKAICERAEHFLANSETITLAGVRRLIEQDLRLEKNALDPFKKYISQQIDQVFNPPKIDESLEVAEKNFDSSKSESSGDAGADEGSESAGGKSDSEEDKVKSRKEQKKRKGSKESEDASRKRRKLKESQKDGDNSESDGGDVLEDGRSPLPVHKPAMRKDKSALGCGNKVEYLKSTIKACGISISPIIYKKAKQLDDDKREAFMLKELEEILWREGLSRNPSEKEIKGCRKRKETAKELEGIDMSNIISCTRRRSTSNFATPSKFEPLAKGSKSYFKEKKSKEKNDEDQNENNAEVKEEQKECEVEEEEEAADAEEEEKDDDEDKEESEEFNEDGNEDND